MEIQPISQAILPPLPALQKLPELEKLSGKRPATSENPLSSDSEDDLGDEDSSGRTTGRWRKDEHERFLEGMAELILCFLYLLFLLLTRIKQ